VGVPLHFEYPHQPKLSRVSVFLVCLDIQNAELVKQVMPFSH